MKSDASSPALRRIARCALVTALILPLALALANAQAPLSDARIKEILTQRIDVDKQAVGLAAVIVEGDKVRVITHGAMGLATAQNNAEPITADTLFEIGSITKTFTALLLADMVIKGEVKLDDPVEKWLPQPDAAAIKTGAAPLRLRDHAGAPVRLIDLATHRSGLPRLPDNILPFKDPVDPYAAYAERDLLNYLAERQKQVESAAGKALKKRDESHEYSNLGFGLLGYVLSRAASEPYVTLLKKRIFTPLGLNDTYAEIPTAQLARLSDGHSVDGTTLKAQKHWRFDVLAGCGSMIMSARDLGRYAQAASGAIDTPLKAAFVLAQKKYAEGGNAINAQGLAWMLMPINDRTLWAHDGGTGGFRSMLLVEPARKTAYAILSNGNVASADIALHLAEPAIPLQSFKSTKEKAVSVDVKTMAQYTGVYRLQPNFDVTIRLRENKLFAQATDQGEFELFGKSNTTFFAKVAPIEIKFEDVKDGKAMRMQITQGGSTNPAPRVE